jgi:hypothetical protein
VDIRSGWSIAGLDVREFPSDDEPLAQTFVRAALRRGVIEGCSKAEYDEVMGADNDFLAQAGIEVTPVQVQGHYQEAHVSGAADARRRQIEASRGLASQGLSYKDDKVRRAALLKQQAKIDAGKVTTDEEAEDAASEAQQEAEQEVEAQTKTSGKRTAKK